MNKKVKNSYWAKVVAYFQDILNLTDTEAQVVTSHRQAVNVFAKDYFLSPELFEKLIQQSEYLPADDPDSAIYFANTMHKQYRKVRMYFWLVGIIRLLMLLCVTIALIWNFVPAWYGIIFTMSLILVIKIKAWFEVMSVKKTINHSRVLSLAAAIHYSRRLSYRWNIRMYTKYMVDFCVGLIMVYVGATTGNYLLMAIGGLVGPLWGVGIYLTYRLRKHGRSLVEDMLGELEW